MKGSKLLRRVLSAALAMLLLTGCGSKQGCEGQPSGTGKSGNEKSITIRLVSIPNTLDCYSAGTVDSEEIAKLIYDLVLNPEPETGAPQPGVVTEWETPDEMTVILTMGDGFMFQNGDKVLPEDIIYSIEQNRDHSLGGHAFSCIESMEAVGDNQVILRLATPFVDVVTALTTVYVYDKSYCESVGDDWANKPVGSGPYKLKQYIPSSKVVVEAWEDYPFEKCYMEEYTFLCMEEDAAAYIALEAGDVDMASISVADYDRAMENPNVNVYETMTILMSQAWMNTQKAPFDNINLRKAMAYSYNREGFLALNKKMAAADSFVPSQAEFYYSAPNVIHYDLDKARELLEKEGYSKNNPLQIELLTYAGESSRQAYEAYQMELRQIGVEMKITTMEFGAYLDKMYKGEFEMISNDWSIPLFLMNYMAMLYSGSLGDYNGSFFVNDACDELYNIAANSITDKQAGIDAARKLQELSWEYVPMIPTFQSRAYVAASKDIQGVVLQNNGRPVLRELCR